MTTYERWALAVGAAAVLVNGILFVVFALQLRVLRQQVEDSRKATQLDHDRRKSQATIEFYAMTLEKRSELRSTLPYDRDAAAIEELLKRAATETDDVGKPVTEYLSLMELLATGVRTDVFDLDSIERIAGGRVRAIARNYKPWIERRRHQFDTPFLYTELEQLADTLEARLAARHASRTLPPS